MSDIFDRIENTRNEQMSRYTTFRTGGAAKYIFKPSDGNEIRDIIKYCRDNGERYIVIGNGSNVLFSDEGYEGIVIQVYSRMNSIRVDGTRIYAQAGALLAQLAKAAKNNELTGLEFAAGIPGTVGGAVVMNAGAYGGEIKDVTVYVDVLEKSGEIKRYSCEEMQFGYRKSIIDSDKVVLGICVELSKGRLSEIEAEMERLRQARLSKQPLELPSAGSTFKRPEGYFAGKLIEDAGLKGYRHGGAMVSDKHSGFIVNYNNATSRDVIELIEYVQKTVKDKFDVELKPEVRIIQ